MTESSVDPGTECQSGGSAILMDSTDVLMDNGPADASRAGKACDESGSNDVVSMNDAIQVLSHVTPKSPTSSMAGTESNTIDPRFVLPKCESPPQQDMEMVSMFVSKAVREEHQKVGESSASSKEYRAIGDAIRLQKDLTLLHKVLLALRTSALQYLSADTKIHARLIHLIMKFVPFPNSTVKSMLTPGDPLDETVVDFDLADAHLNLMTALVSANSLYVVPAVTALWKMLTFRITDSHKERTRRVHAALATILRLCPKARTELFPIIASNTPFRLKTDAELLWYYRQCLYVLKYLPSIRGQILELVIDRCLELDVEIVISDVGEASLDTSSDNDDDIPKFPQEDLNRDHNPNSNVTLNGEDVTVDEMAEKLDSMMLILFEYFEESISSGISASELFQILLQVFEASIINTHKSKFVQFLILYLCGLDAKSASNPESASVLYREFAAKLIDFVLDPYRATVTRQTGACYLASFISRANYVCAETASEAIDALLRWAEAYIQSLGDVVPVQAADSREQSRLHALFYTVCQSAFYIMCFRGVEVVQFCRAGLQSHDGHRPELGSERWTLICTHPLLPLRVCLESVRLEFLRISQMFGLMDDQVLDRLLEDDRHQCGSERQRKRKRVSLISTAVTLEKERRRGGVGGLGRGTNPLDSFFPFDPYLLRLSHGSIEPFYIHWEGGASDEDMISFAASEQHDPGEIVENGEDEEVDSLDEKAMNENDNSDPENEKEAVARRNRLMSFASNATSVSDHPGSFDENSVLLNIAKIDDCNQEWNVSLKRARAPSLESNGSW